MPSVPPASNSRLSPLPPEPVGFNYDHEATIDIPLDTASGGSHYQVCEEWRPVSKCHFRNLVKHWILLFWFYCLNLGFEEEREGTPG